jgi:hypothetical protein
MTLIMLTSTVTSFTEYFRILQVMLSPHIDSAEAIMAAASTEYHRLLGSDEGWLQTKRAGSTFQAQQSPLQQRSAGTQPTKANGPEYDRRGNLIDRSPPATGSPHTRQKNDGTPEYWCSTCNRSGNHLDGLDHDAFQSKLKAFREKMKKSRQNKSTDDAPTGTNAAPVAPGASAYVTTVNTPKSDPSTTPSSSLGIIQRMTQLRDS